MPRDSQNPPTPLFDDYEKHISERVHFCLIINGEIVSITESENIPHEPEGIVELGIRTLKEHRRKGYGTIVCAAFIKQCLKEGNIPVWSVEFDNVASEGMAKKLGFRHMGNIMYVGGL